MAVSAIAPGARVLIRDAEWIVKRVDRTGTGGQSIQVVGVSEIVRHKEARFLSEIEGKSITVLDPAETELVPDASPQFRNSRLYIESLLRQSPPTGNDLWIGHRAAIDDLPYQLDPALLALEQPRQRILMADAVGLGKTIEMGILLSELINRGKGKRILVVTTKSMMAQFQKELWARLAASIVSPGSFAADLWLFDLSRGLPVQFTSSPGDETTAIWSPDDRRIVFGVDSPHGLYEKSTDLIGKATQFTAIPNTGPYNASSWSRDGRFIIYKSGPGDLLAHRKTTAPWR